MPTALIVQGGWQGHQPAEVAEIFARILRTEGFAVRVADTLEAYSEAGLAGVDLIVPLWTMGKLSKEQGAALCAAVRERGVGLAGCHGGMCDAFREHTEYQFMTGGQWVAHPGEDRVTYTVRVRDLEHVITRGIEDFEVTSEQYYLHVDPAVRVLASTHFPTPGVEGPHVVNGSVEMPQVWTKGYGKGRVFYCALGHQASVFEIKEARELMRRELLWAAGILGT